VAVYSSLLCVRAPLVKLAHMTPLLYDELVAWYRLLDPTADHGDEAGHHAYYLKSRFRCTLTDVSTPVLGFRGLRA
jgi:hypothetical protein